MLHCGVHVVVAGAPSRQVLLEGVDFFVRHAVSLAGIRKIALIGSLMTDKPSPKDADVLVWIEDNMDLAPLAALGRRFIGRMQSRGRGADIFLANAQGEYLGRTCLWKDCRRGIRRSCDAIHCGRRPYLHDDLLTVALAPSLVISPPIVVWPEVEAEGPLPTDVEALIESWRATGLMG